MNKTLSAVVAAVFTVASAPAFAQQAQQGMSLGGPRTMGSPPMAQGGGGEMWRRPGGGGQGRGWQGGQGRGGFQGGGGRAQYGWRGDGGRRHRGGEIGAGLAGLAAGAVVGGALASQSYGYPYQTYGYPDQTYANPDYGYSDSEYDDVYQAPVVQAGGDATGYCLSRFKSYDPASGTYLGYDGARHPCP